MEGGKIIDCYGESAGAVNNSSDYGLEATFIMRGGDIENNSSDDGVAVYNAGTMHMSEDASIPMKGDKTNKVMLGAFSSIDIDSDLSSSENILLTTNRYIPETDS